MAWRVHDAQHWGVPQRRRRISVVADFGGDTAGEILFERKIVSRHPAESGASGERLAEAAESGFNPAVARSLTARADGSPCADRGPNIVCSPHQGGCDGGKGDPSPTLTAGDRPGVTYISGFDGYNGDLTGDVASTIGINCGMSTGRNGVMELSAKENGSMARDSVLCAGFKAGQCAQAGGIGYSEEVSPTLDATDRHGVCAGFEATPINLMVATRCKELGRGTGFGVGEPGDPANTISASHSHGVFATAIGNQVPLAYGIGNGQACEASIMAEEIAQTLNTMHDAQAVMCEDVSHALRAKANCAYREDEETYPVQNMVARRLTPMECERLQGFPDGWTDIGEWRDSKGKLRKPSDSPRYKALGNSIALPFWDFLAKRISAQYLRPVTMGSLFDGIGGFPLVFERHNGKGSARWASEIEEFPIAVTKLRFGED